MRATFQDLRFGLRLLLASPGFTAVAVLTLALGIAANTTVFSWIDGVLLHPFGGATNSDELAVVEMITTGAPNGATQMSYLDYRDYQANLKSLAGLALHREDVFSLGDRDHSQAVWGELVSGNYFSVLGVRPVLGRTFTREEEGDQPGAYPVAVISYGLWQSQFHGDPAAAGKTLRVNRRELTVVGVAPPEFHGTMPGLVFGIWVPVTMGRELGLLGDGAFRSRAYRGMYVLARLGPGVRMQQARAEAATFARNLEAAHPNTNRGVSATVLPLWEFHSAAPDLLLRPLRILMAISILVLLIVCANVANLLLARSVSRRKELSIRMALGAGGGRLTRQLLTETFLLALGGALGGLLLAFWMGDLLPSMVPKIGVTVVLGFGINGRILAFTIVTCVLATLLCGAAPALFWLHPDVNEALKEGGRSGGHGVQSHRTRGLLVISEVALATVALTGAGLFLRSFQNARAIYPGFDKHNLTLTRFYLGGTGFSTLDLQQFCVRLRDRLRSLPGVVEVSYADYAPLGSSGGPYTRIDVEGYVPGQVESMSVNRYLTAPRYFETMRTPLLEGRDFQETDDRNSLPVLIVNQAFAQRYFHGANPVGRRVRCWGKWATVVGMVQDSKYFHPAEAPRPHFFAPYRQLAGSDGQLYFYVRATGDQTTLMAALRREVTAVDPNAGAFDVMPMTEWMQVTLLPLKVAASMLTTLGLIALVLAAVGLYSVMAYAVTQRTQEIGIRMALGAQTRDVLADVLWRGLFLTASGVVVGVAVAFGVTRVVASMLVNVSAADPLTFAGAALFLVAVALVASYLPARRAAKVDPMVALRCE